MQVHEDRLTLVFINSIGTDFRIWEDVVEALKEHTNILLFDNRGHGLSNVVYDTNSIHDFVEDTLGLLGYLGINKSTLVGLSLGGMVAQIIANHSPNSIDRLILCDTSYLIGNTAFWNERIAKARAEGLSSVSDSVMPRWFSESFIRDEAQKVSGYKNMLERMPVTGYTKACEALRDANLKEIASGIKHPTLCVVGSEDKSTTPDDVKALADVIEHSQFEIIEGSGHLPCVDNPEALSKLILQFLRLNLEATG